MLKFFQHLWSAAYDLTPSERSRTVRIVSHLAAVAVVLVLLLAGKAAGQVVPAEHPIWELVLQARLALVRLVLAVPVLVLGVLVALVIYQAIENSDLGKRLLIWHEADDVHVEGAKTRNAGMLLCFLLAACILGMLLGVLR